MQASSYHASMLSHLGPLLPPAPSSHASSKAARQLGRRQVQAQPVKARIQGSCALHAHVHARSRQSVWLPNGACNHAARHGTITEKLKLGCCLCTAVLPAEYMHGCLRCDEYVPACACCVLSLETGGRMRICSTHTLHACTICTSHTVIVVSLSLPHAPVAVPSALSPHVLA